MVNLQQILNLAVENLLPYFAQDRLFWIWNGVSVCYNIGKCYEILYKGVNFVFSGKDLKAFRNDRGWSLRQFSLIVGVSVKTLQVIEKENKPVPLQLRLALAAVKSGIHPIDE